MTARVGANIEQGSGRRVFNAEKTEGRRRGEEWEGGSPQPPRGRRMDGERKGKRLGTFRLNWGMRNEKPGK